MTEKGKFPKQDFEIWECVGMMIYDGTCILNEHVGFVAIVWPKNCSMMSVQDSATTVDLDDWTDNDIVIKTDPIDQVGLPHNGRGKPPCSQHSAAEHICHASFIPQTQSDI